MKNEVENVEFENFNDETVVDLQSYIEFLEEENKKLRKIILDLKND